jgi:fructokinase
MTTRLLVVGEALVDIVTDPTGATAEHVGGSPANVAMGLARLGHAASIATWLGRDERGRRVTAHLADHGVEMLADSYGDAPTSTAVARLDGFGAATYEFDLHWDLPSLEVPDQAGHVHTGSLGAVLAPGAAAVRAAIVAAHARCTTSYDPNVRPGIMGDPDPLRAQVEDHVGLSDVVKASEDDLQALYAGLSPEQVMDRWVGLGAAMAVVTLGGDGVVFRVASAPDVVRAPTRATRVVDTVGAGDSFMAGLLSGLVSSALLGDPAARERLRGATLEDVTPAVDRGLATSGVTVGRAGAYAPGLDEL